MAHSPETLRNVVVMGHADAGKTSLVEAMLHRAGAIGRLGSIQAGTTVCDFEGEEKQKQHSISSAVAHLSWNGVEVNLLDTPGYTDFFGETHCAVAAADVALIVVNAKTGIGLNTRRAWRLAEEHGLARMVVINKLDADNVELEGLVGRIREVFGAGCVWFRPPDATGSRYTGNTDAMQDEASRELITEAAVEGDEALLEKYLEEGAIEPEELRGAVAQGIRDGRLVPLVGASATQELGVADVLHVLVTYLPSPLTARRRVTTDGQELAPEGPFVGQVFKVSVGEHGPLNYQRVLSGEVGGHTTLLDVRSGGELRVGDFQRPQGKQLEPLTQLIAGDIAIVPKVDDLRIGDTITDGKATVSLPPIRAPEPMVALAVSPKTRNDETKLRPALDRLEREDPTFKTERHEETHELVIKGMSMLHLESLLERMKERSKVEVERHLPTIAFRETIRGRGDARYRHKKQSGGAGEFGEVALRVSPAERGEGFVFENKVVGGVISGGFIPAVEKGIAEAMEHGVVAGYRFVDVRVELYDGKEHPVDSKEVAFKKAARGAFKQAVEQAKPTLLEPIVEVTITAPDGHTGDIMGDLARRRSQPQGMEQSDEGTIIKALVPEMEMLTYSQDLRSMTSGEGVYTMQFSHYAVLPPDRAQALIDAHEKERGEHK